jgi:hypothetical protein
MNDREVFPYFNHLITGGVIEVNHFVNCDRDCFSIQVTTGRPTIEAF